MKSLDILLVLSTLALGGWMVYFLPGWIGILVGAGLLLGAVTASVPLLLGASPGRGASHGIARFMRKIHRNFKGAVRLLERGQAARALALAEDMIGSEDVMDQLDGYTCRGMVFEDGGLDVAVDLDRSLESYRRASLICPNAISFMHMARISLRRREFSQALKFLEISAGYERSPEILLGFAQWFEESDPKGSRMAKSYYMKAALRGRFAGFFGYSRVARAAGEPWRALAMDIARIGSGPLIALAIGTRARFSF